MNGGGGGPCPAIPPQLLPGPVQWGNEIIQQFTQIRWRVVMMKIFSMSNNVC